MQLKLITPERQVLDTEVEEVYAPGVAGEFGVLPGHITFMTALSVGVLRYKSQGREHFVSVSGGFVEVLNDTVTVLADTAEQAEEIDAERAKRAEERARAALGQIEPATPEQFDLQSALSRALNRLQVSTRHSGRAAAP
jgi:F-type H+-transporting ATPase subunit epsilon